MQLFAGRPVLSAHDSVVAFAGSSKTILLLPPLYPQVMAVNLMGLEGQQTTVAVVGLAHVDGIEAILAANGWKPQRC